MSAKKALIAGVLTIVLSRYGHAQFVNFAQWQQLPPASQNAYIAGSIDALAVFLRTDHPDIVDDIWKCLAKMSMRPAQLAENVKIFAASKPELHAGPVQAAMFDYLKAACKPQ